MGLCSLLLRAFAYAVPSAWSELLSSYSNATPRVRLGPERKINTDYFNDICSSITSTFLQYNALVLGVPSVKAFLLFHLPFA